MSWSERLNTPFLFFTGKGGVGKTSLACATALHLAEQGKSVLIISTDPASNLDEVFGCPLNDEPTAIPSVPGLWAANLDPHAAAAAYREKAVGPFRGKLPPAVIRTMEEQFSGACTTELAAFDQFVEWLAQPEARARMDHVIFDTAPTGHTLRLLSLPGAWSDYLNTTTAESSCLGPLAALKDKRAHYALALEQLRDPQKTTVALVTRPEAPSLQEAARSATELQALGLGRIELLVNGILPADSSDAFAQGLYQQQQQSLQSTPTALQSCATTHVPLLANNLVGIQALRALSSGDPGSPDTRATSIELPVELTGLHQLAHELAAQGSGVIMTMGKGGVGKTAVAVQLATLLSQLGKRVRLTTTDPAGDVLQRTRGNTDPHLQIDRIDPEAELEKYRKDVVDRAASQMTAEALELLKEDLRSPCTEEIAVFRAFADAFQPGQADFVIIDTAPTGHTILLMDASEAYHREVARLADGPEAVRELLQRLRDPNYTRVLLVTLPEPTPLHEAMHLQSDLKRAEIDTYAWIVNRSLLATGTQDPLLLTRARNESDCLNELLALGERVYLEPMTLQQELMPA